MDISGYNQLIPHVASSKKYYVISIEGCKLNRYSNEAGRYIRRIMPILPRGIPFLTSRHYTNPLAELYASSLPGDIIHHINADDSFFLHGMLRFKKKKRLVATIHQPLKIFKEIMPSTWRRYFRRLDALITIASREYKYFKKALPGVKVVHIPHGNNNQHFKGSSLNEKVGICIGGWQRDHETILKAMKIVKHHHPEFILYIINRRKPAEYGKTDSNVQFRINIPDSQLLDFYREAAMCVLPLKDCTANNAILEALASGIPVITNYVGGVRDYTDIKCASYFKPRDHDDLAAKIISVLDSKKKLKKMSQAALKRSRQYDWDLITEKIKTEVYVQT
ncbi:glycosyltransferase [Candidatus Bathyarchaeota archaeon]|nr:glycosyltransferase [Candidatus Bathyarchaeota archaeon]